MVLDRTKDLAFINQAAVAADLQDFLGSLNPLAGAIAGVISSVVSRDVFKALPITAAGVTNTGGSQSNMAIFHSGFDLRLQFPWTLRLRGKIDQAKDEIREMTNEMFELSAELQRYIYLIPDDHYVRDVGPEIEKYASQAVDRCLKAQKLMVRAIKHWSTDVTMR